MPIPASSPLRLNSLSPRYKTTLSARRVANLHRLGNQRQGLLRRSLLPDLAEQASEILHQVDQERSLARCRIDALECNLLWVRAFAQLSSPSSNKSLFYRVAGHQGVHAQVSGEELVHRSHNVGKPPTKCTAASVFGRTWVDGVRKNETPSINTATLRE